MRPRVQGQPQRLHTIAGSVPELADLPAGCTFAGRCSFTQPACFTQPPPSITLPSGALDQTHQVHCLRPEAYAVATETPDETLA
jgi:oligopeptide/dipeptide ABC transporter ATP-binding protein